MLNIALHAVSTVQNIAAWTPEARCCCPYCWLCCVVPCSKTEMLAKSNKFECDTCGSHQEAQRAIKIRAAPACLILHLKRFKFIEQLRRCVDTVLA